MPSSSSETRTEQSLGPGASFTLTVNTTNADRVVMLVDDGAGGAPAAYDLDQNVYSVAFDDWQQYGSSAGVTTQSWQDPAIPAEWRITLTNPSGTETFTYRVRLLAIKDN